MQKVTSIPWTFSISSVFFTHWSPKSCYSSSSLPCSYSIIYFFRKSIWHVLTCWIPKSCCYIELIWYKYANHLKKHEASQWWNCDGIEGLYSSLLSRIRSKNRPPQARVSVIHHPQTPCHDENPSAFLPLHAGACMTWQFNGAKIVLVWPGSRFPALM